MRAHAQQHPESKRADAMAATAPLPRVQHDEVSRCSASTTMLARFDLLRLIQAVAGALRREWDRALRAQIPELGAPRASVILQLGRCGGASQTRLARLLGLSPMTVSRLLDGLKRRGWVHREPMPADRRAWAVRLTDEGKHVLVAIHGARIAFVDRICAALDDERRTILVSTLAALESGTRSVMRGARSDQNNPSNGGLDGDGAFAVVASPSGFRKEHRS